MDAQIPQARAMAYRFIKTYLKYFNNHHKEDYLPAMYRQNSVIVWCGNPVAMTPSGIQAFFRAFSSSEASILTWDAQPIRSEPEDSENASGHDQTPILVTIYGLMTSPQPEAEEDRNGRGIGTDSVPREVFANDTGCAAVERNFHQTFVLTPEAQSHDQTLYYISCDVFRYI